MSYPPHAVPLLGGVVIAAFILTGCSYTNVEAVPVRDDTATPPSEVQVVTAEAATPLTAASRASVDDAAEPGPTAVEDTTDLEPPEPEGPGLLMFRGNPTRTFYGTGPIEGRPQQLWRYPDSPMCGTSSVGGESKTWCGTGWTGQPAVWVRPDGVTEVVFGAYDYNVHFVDAATGSATRTPFATNDLIKGSVTIDPDGYPLVYFGSRDSKLRIVALDREEPTELWSLDADVVDGVWNDDWDGNPLILDDVLYEGGENGWFFTVKLNRSYAPDGVVEVAPEILVAHPGYTSQLIDAVGRNVSIESSVVLSDETIYFANSGGRVLGLDQPQLVNGQASEVFDFWMGDDVDATIVADPDGSIYVAAELERFNSRAAEVGQLVKLDPQKDDPLVWSIDVPPIAGGAGGLWATPALGDGVLYASTHPGELLVVETNSGEVLWRDDIGWNAWSSPVIIDDTLIVATCSGELRGYSLNDPRRPVLDWQVQIESEACIESTPAIWGGTVYVGARDGFLYAFGAA